MWAAGTLAPGPSGGPGALAQRAGRRSPSHNPEHLWIAEGATMMRSGPSAGTTRCVRDGLGGNEWVLLICFLTISGATRACLKLRTTGLQNRRTRWETDCVAGAAGFEPLHSGIEIRQDSRPGAAGFEPLHIRIGICQDSQPGGGIRTCASRIKGAPDRRLKPVEAG